MSTSDLCADDRLLFFPTIGRRDPASGLWRLPIQGWVFQPKEDSLRRAVAVTLLRRLAGLSSEDVQAATFDDRVRAFLVDNQGGRSIAIRLAGQSFRLPPTMASGHVEHVIDVDDAAVETARRDWLAREAPPASPNWLRFDASLLPADVRQISGCVHLLGELGASVISDIDDTIKVSHVRDRGQLFRQTFVRDFEAVPGMAGAYARWAAAGASFHYVSRSPWQLFEPLAAFLRAAGFPRGTFHMRKFRWKEGRTLPIPGRRTTPKRHTVAAIIESFPQRRFVLVGDSGERDPEIYGHLAREYPAQVAGVFIRNTTGEPADGERYRAAFADIAADRWRVFDDPGSLPATIA